MIIDKLENGTYYYGISERIQKAFEYLRNSNLMNMEPGRYEIENDDIYAMVFEYETKSIEGVLWEAHKSYIDIQYMIKGSEKMGYTTIENIKTTVEYDSSKDVLFGEADGDFMTVKEGMFAIFAPQDGHMPSISIEGPEKVKRVVVKVRVD